MFDIHFKAAKNMFFDRTLIKQKVDTATRKRLSKFGAYVRQTAKRSIRKRKRSSLPVKQAASRRYWNTAAEQRSSGAVPEEERSPSKRDRSWVRHSIRS